MPQTRHRPPHKGVAPGEHWNPQDDRVTQTPKKDLTHMTTQAAIATHPNMATSQEWNKTCTMRNSQHRLRRNRMMAKRPTADPD